MDGSVPSPLRVVLGEREPAGLDEVDVVEEDLVVTAHLVGRLGPANGAGHLLPAVGRALAVVGQRLLEQLVLLSAPIRGRVCAAAGGGAP